ncbi:MAG: hypothetical protein ACK53Z_15205 [Betaproteobacteria bacterium]|jgi:hypothetical protein
MAAGPPAKPGAVKRADALMTPRREAAAPIPTLTDLVSAPATAPGTSATRPAGNGMPAVPALLSPSERHAIEEAVFERLRARLETEVIEVLAQRIIPDITAWLREAVPAAVEEALQAGVPPSRP